METDSSNTLFLEKKVNLFGLVYCFCLNFQKVTPNNVFIAKASFSAFSEDDSGGKAPDISLIISKLFLDLETHDHQLQAVY